MVYLGIIFIQSFLAYWFYYSFLISICVIDSLVLLFFLCVLSCRFIVVSDCLLCPVISFLASEDIDLVV